MAEEFYLCLGLRTHSLVADGRPCPASAPQAGPRGGSDAQVPRPCYQMTTAAIGHDRSEWLDVTPQFRLLLMQRLKLARRMCEGTVARAPASINIIKRVLPCEVPDRARAGWATLT